MRQTRRCSPRRHRQRMKTEASQTAYSRRQHFGETPFAVIKACLDLRSFLLRGIEGVGQEWQLVRRRSSEETHEPLGGAAPD
ncbi:MAG: transposase [Pirellulaceae bacterium]